MSVSAVIPVHNRADLIEKLLATVRLQTVPFDEILVIDNASADSAAQVAADAGCNVIAMGRNAGFAAAVNRGWQAAKGEWVAILNSDVELDAHWLERLLEGVGPASFATGKVLSAANPTLIDGTYDLLSRSGCAWRAGHGQPDIASDQTSVEKTKPISIAPGTACLFRRAVLAQLNGLDESYDSYLEDVDLGLRCLGAGFTGVYVPTARAWHHGSATFGRWNPAVVRLISRNQLTLISRHYDRALFRSCLWPIVVGQFLWGLVALRHGAFGAWFAGKREALASFHPGGKPSEAMKAFLDASELEIENTATDPYWRLFFRCVPRKTTLGRFDT